MLLHDAKQVLRNGFYYYVLVVQRTLKKVLSRFSFSDNSVQMLSLMHSNVQ